MAKIDTFIRKVEKLIDRLPELMLNTTEAIAGNAADAVVNRLTETGRNDKGEPFRPYSEEYQNRKEKKGRYTGFVNFRDEGRMLNNIAVIDKKTQTGKVAAVVGAKAQENRDKLDGNIQQRGDILALSKQEIATLKGDFKKDFARRLNKELK